MSVAKLKTKVARLPLAERIELAGFLAIKASKSHQTRMAHIEHRVRSQLRGRALTPKQREGLHDTLKAIGI